MQASLWLGRPVAFARWLGNIVWPCSATPSSTGPSLQITFPTMHLLCAHKIGLLCEYHIKHIDLKILVALNLLGCGGNS